MRKITLVSVLLLSLLPVLRAQVTAEISMEQEFFLVGEKIPVAVRITNRSGQTLHLGQEEDWLTFAVESRAAYLAEKNGEVPVDGEFELESGKTAIRRVDLAPYFALNKVGRYQITANVRIKQWDTAVATKPKAIEIINGAKIWAQDFGMPPAAGVTNQAPEVRRYSLEQANYLHGKLRLYLRLTDVDGSHVFKVVPIGGMVSFSNPETQIDNSNRLHVLYQFGARSYLYSVITPEGDIIQQQTYDIARNRPRLFSDEKGSFVVNGGERRINDNDIPAPTAAAAP